MNRNIVFDKDKILYNQTLYFKEKHPRCYSYAVPTNNTCSYIQPFQQLLSEIPQDKIIDYDEGGGSWGWYFMVAFEQNDNSICQIFYSSNASLETNLYDSFETYISTFEPNWRNFQTEPVHMENLTQYNNIVNFFDLNFGFNFDEKTHH